MVWKFFKQCRISLLKFLTRNYSVSSFCPNIRHVTGLVIRGIDDVVVDTTDTVLPELTVHLQQGGFRQLYELKLYQAEDGSLFMCFGYKEQITRVKIFHGNFGPYSFLALQQQGSTAETLCFPPVSTITGTAILRTLELCRLLSSIQAFRLTADEILDSKS